MTGPANDVTTLLSSARSGDGCAADVFMPVVYEELKRIAQAMLAGERPGHTLSATALVHEAYLRLIDQTRADLRDEQHFKAVAAQCIRRILVDHARARSSRKRGGDQERLTLTTRLLRDEVSRVDLVEFDDLLQSLANEDGRAAEVVELRFFGGMTTRQVADFLNISTATVDRDWQFARAWLYAQLFEGQLEQGAS